MIENIHPDKDTPLLTSSDITNLLDTFAWDISILSSTSHIWIPVELQLAKKYIAKVITDAIEKGEFTWKKGNLRRVRIITLYERRNRPRTKWELHWEDMEIWRKERSLELIAYCKLAKELKIDTWINIGSLNIWSEVDTIVSWLREYLMIPEQMKIAA